MKKVLLVFVTVLVTVSGYAQKTADIGIWGGSSAVFGDMDNSQPFRTFNLNYGAYFRYNFNARVAIKAMFLSGKFANDGTIQSKPWFFNKNIEDLSVQVEINYLKYILGAKRTKFSPYVTAGLGVAYLKYNLRPIEIAAFNPDYPNLAEAVNSSERIAVPTLPFGIGIKYALTKRLEISTEYQMRKYLSDKIDDLDDPLSHTSSSGKVVSYNKGVHNNDWGAYLGLSIVYKIYIGKRACPAYESKN